MPDPPAGAGSSSCRRPARTRCPGRRGAARVERPATAMSTAHTTDIPAPAAQPGTAATTGTAHVAMAVTMPWNASASRRRTRPGPRRRERLHVAARAEARAFADHQRGADLGRIGAVQRLGDERQPRRRGCRGPRATRSRSTRPSRTTRRHGSSSLRSSAASLPAVRSWLASALTRPPRYARRPRSLRCCSRWWPASSLTPSPELRQHVLGELGEEALLVVAGTVERPGG